MARPKSVKPASKRFSVDVPPDVMGGLIQIKHAAEVEAKSHVSLAEIVRQACVEFVEKRGVK